MSNCPIAQTEVASARLKLLQMGVCRVCSPPHQSTEYISSTTTFMLQRLLIEGLLFPPCSTLVLLAKSPPNVVLELVEEFESKV
jgi:hypothetical protein